MLAALIAFYMLGAATATIAIVRDVVSRAKRDKV